MLIGALKAQRRARIVGSPTGGNVAGSTAGVLFFLKLPESGLVLRLPAQRMMTDYNGEDVGRGVRPDVEVTATVADLRAGRDPVLEAALAERWREHWPQAPHGILCGGAGPPPSPRLAGRRLDLSQ